MFFCAGTENKMRTGVLPVRILLEDMRYFEKTSSGITRPAKEI